MQRPTHGYVFLKRWRYLPVEFDNSSYHDCPCDPYLKFRESKFIIHCWATSNFAQLWELGDDSDAYVDYTHAVYVLLDATSEYVSKMIELIRRLDEADRLRKELIRLRCEFGFYDEDYERGRRDDITSRGTFDYTIAFHQVCALDRAFVDGDGAIKTRVFSFMFDFRALGWTTIAIHVT